MKKWLVMVLLVLGLCGCGSTEVMETVADEWMQSAAAPMAELHLHLPEEAALPVSESENASLYQCDGYELLVQTLASGDLDATLRSVTGYGKEKLELLGKLQELAKFYDAAYSQMGEYPAYFKKGYTQADLNAKTIADAADAGDETAINVYRTCGEYLGKGLSIIIDILNPEVIVIGSIFARSHNLLWEPAKKVIDKEALSLSAKCCKVVPAVLGEQIGDYAAIATALL